MTRYLLTILALSAVFLPLPGFALEEGWQFSPMPGEGDRASLGCASESDAEDFTCVAVRCEDDFSVGFYIHTSRPEGDAGRWLITIDKEERWVATEVSEGPYRARVTSELEWLRDRLEQGGLAFLHPEAGRPPLRNGIPLNGSIYAINEALAFCAPRVPTPGEPVPANDSHVIE